AQYRCYYCFFFSSRRRHTRFSRDWSSDVCSSDLFRGTIELIDNGFVPSINNTVGLGFGADITPNALWIPVVLQWNFFLSNRWSRSEERRVGKECRARWSR